VCVVIFVIRLRGRRINYWCGFSRRCHSDKLACHANARDSCELNITSENDNQTQTKNNKIGDISFRADINYRTKGDARLSSPILHINKRKHTDTV